MIIIKYHTKILLLISSFMYESRFVSFFRLRSKDIEFIHRLFDPFFITIFYYHYSLPLNLKIYGIDLNLMFINLLILIAILNLSSLYRSFRITSYTKLFKKITFTGLCFISTFLGFVYFMDALNFFQKSDLIKWILTSMTILYINHLGVRIILRNFRKNGNNFRKIVFWGSLEGLKNFEEQINNNSWMGLKLINWENFYSNDEKFNSLSKIDKFRKFINTQSVDYVFFDSINKIERDNILKILGDTLIPLVYAPEWMDQSMIGNISYIGNQPCIDIWGYNVSIIEIYIKRFFDLFFSIIGIILFLPIFVVIGIIIKIDSQGPIFYKQERYGIMGGNFHIYKFRSMHVTESGRQNNLQQAKVNDKRITKVGKYLRKWSIDEFPQIFNVFLGSMSFIGPRPHAIFHNELYRKKLPGYMQRHACKPGITGLAQVKGLRGATSDQDMKNRLDADMEYQKEWSIFLDLKILLKTFNINILRGN